MLSPVCGHMLTGEMLTGQMLTSLSNKSRAVAGDVAGKPREAV